MKSQSRCLSSRVSARVTKDASGNYPGPVAQRLEQGTHNPLVGGSNPSGPTIFDPDGHKFADRLHQRVVTRSNSKKRKSGFHGDGTACVRVAPDSCKSGLARLSPTPPYAVRPHARTSTSYRHSAPWCSLCSGNRLSAVGFIRAEIRAFWIMQVAYRTLPAALVSAVSSAAASWQGLHNLSPSVAGNGHGKGCPCCLLVHRQFSIGATPSVEILFAQV